MVPKQLIRVAMRAISILMICSMLPVQNAAAWDIEPGSVADYEGAVIQFKITMLVDDWVKPDSAALQRCAASGIDATWVARFAIERQEGSAEFGLNESRGDLHLEYKGITYGDLDILWCLPGPFATNQTDRHVTVHLHEDDETEPNEVATLRFSKVDLAGRETLLSTIPITVLDVQGPINQNECSSTPLTLGVEDVAASFSESDCDDSPRGARHLADSFTYQGVAGEVLPVHAEWGSMDGVLYLEAPGGGIEAENDDFHSDSASHIEVTLQQTGTYRIWATTNEENVTGDYEISLVSSEKEDTSDWRLDIVAVTPTVLDDGDLIAITVQGAKNIPPTFVSAGFADVVYLVSEDPVISLDDTELGAESYCCASTFEEIWQGPLDVTPGTYWVGACLTNEDVDPTNNCTAATEVTVGGDSTCSSSVLSCGQSLAGALLETSCTSGPLGVEYGSQRFAVNGAAGDTLWLDADWELDGYLLLQSPQGVILAENDNHTGAADSHIEYTLQESGTHTLWATSREPGATGSYSVSLECEPPSGPDLTVSMPSLAADILVPGQAIELSTQVRNAGDKHADATTLSYVLSSDARIDRSDPEIAMDGTPDLEARANRTVSRALIAPVTPGTYWLGVCAAPVSGEAAISNNCSAGRRVDVKTQPQCTRRPASCGETVSASLNIQDCSSNPRGTGFLSEAVELHMDAGSSLAADASFTGVDGYLLLQDPSGNIVASNDDTNGQQHSRVEYAVQTSGVHRIWMSGYKRGAVGSYAVEVLCGSQADPDLVASAVSAGDSDVRVDESIGLAATLRNDGGSASAPATVHFMLSTDAEISADDPVMASVELDAIAPGASLEAQASVTMPAVAGNYWVGVCVDPVDGETLITNNCSNAAGEQAEAAASGTGTGTSQAQWSGNVGTLLNVSAGSGCTSGVLSCGKTQAGTLALSGCDYGPLGNGHIAQSYSFSGVAGDLISLNAKWTDLDGYLHLLDPSGAVVSENDDFQGYGNSRIETELQQSGTYHVWVSQQAKGQIGSYDLSLYCDAIEGPDLQVQAVQMGASSIRSGQLLELSAEVTNRGGEAASATNARFILSGSPDLSANDLLLGSSDVPALSPNVTSPEALSLPLNVVPGTYWAAVCVDADVLELDTENNCALAGQLTVQADNHPIDITPGMNDAWYNPATDGQGFFINVFPDSDQVFLSWFTYDLDLPDGSETFELGDPGQRWLVALGSIERGVATLDVYLNQGGAFDQSQPAPEESLYGSMTLTFSDCKNGLIEYDLPDVGEQGTIPITRIAGDNIKACQNDVGIVSSTTAQASSPVVTVDDASFSINPGLNDAWFNPETSGQGFSFNVFPRQGSVFMSWFTYDTEPAPAEATAQLGTPGLRWLTALGAFDGNVAELTLFNVSGGVFNAGDPAPVEAAYGSVTIEFDDCNSGELHYDIPSIARQGVVPIQRLVRDTVPDCERAQARQRAELLVVEPRHKGTVENFCAGSNGWLIDWPDMPHASAYTLELWRNDALFPMSFSVAESEFRYLKETAVPDEHLAGWKWRYRPEYSAFEQAAEFTPFFTFDVEACGQ